METMVEVPGGGLFVEDVGEGPVVTLLHPGLWDRRTWDPQMQLLQDERFRVIRYDQRGYGRSEPPPADGAPYSAIDDLRAVLDDREVATTALVGCSMGGALAIDATLSFPERVWALVPVAAGLGGVEPTKEEIDWYGDIGDRYDAAIAAGDVATAQAIELDEVWAVLGTDDPAGARIREIAMDNLAAETMDESGKQRLDPPAAARLGEIHVPTLVIEAEHDPPDMRRLNDLMEAGIAGARRVTIDADHVVNLRAPAAFDAEVIPFLREHAPR